MAKKKFDQGYLQEILRNFQIRGKTASVVPFGSGHIHDTFLAKNSVKGCDSYILQRINTTVFPDVEVLMSNFAIVTEHLRKKLAAEAGSNHQMEALTLVCASDGSAYYQDRQGYCWRLLVYIDDTVSYDRVEDEGLAYQGGRGFGRFLYLLSDLEPERLIEVIPGFHDIDHRLDQLDRAAGEDLLSRKEGVKKELEFVAGRAEAMRKIKEMGRVKLLPCRVTHNDTKFNNLLLNRQGEARCVVDLDTVMPGYLAYDFGDALRSLANSGREDAQSLAEVRFNKALFESFARGFIEQTADSLSKEEVESLAEGCLLMPYLLGVRFLTDHIGGDNYFKADYDGHNLNRARVQFRLLELIERERGWLAGFIKKTHFQRLKINGW